MEKKYGAFRKQKLPDGSPKHIYLQSVDSHSLMDNNFFQKCRRDVVEYVRGGQALDVLIMNTGEPLTDADDGHLLTEFQSFCETNGARMILVLTTEACQYRHTYLKSIKHLYDLNLQLLCYDNLKKLLSQNSNGEVSSTSGILHLTGKSNKVQRLGLLYQCHLDNVTDRFVSSSWLPNERTDWIDNILGCDDQEYQQFLKGLSNNSIDGITARTNHDLSNVHYWGLPYDPLMYKKNFCSLVNETWIHSPIHITEKTWRTIDNLHPFVVAGSPGTINYLESVGIDCYREYVSYPDYDNFKRDHTSTFEDLQPWFKQIIRNCLDIEELPAEAKDKVRAVAVMNRNIMQQLISQNKEKLAQFYKLDGNTLFDESLMST